jgi:hypothetical protein
MAFGRCGLSTQRVHIVLLGLVGLHVGRYDDFEIREEITALCQQRGVCRTVFRPLETNEYLCA